MSVRRIVAAAGFAVLAMAGAAEAGGIKIGTLTCNVEGGIGFIIGSSKDMECTFHGNAGVEHYSGVINKFGLDIGYVSEAEFIPDARLRAARIADAEIFTAAHVVVLRERQHSRIIKAFLDVVHGALQD